MANISEIIKEGVLIEPRIAERISKMGEGEFAELMERMRAEKPLILSEDFFENMIEVSEMQEPGKFSMQESIAGINSYFSALQRLFEKRNRAVSISNASENASVIGIVKSVLQDGFEVEDQTGSIKVISKTQVEEDDAVMVTGKLISKALYADYVGFPDMRERQMRKSPKKCEVLFSAKPREGGDYSISFGEKMSMMKGSLIVGKSPVQVKINNILMLVHNGCVKEKSQLAQILKKRRLPGTLFAIAEAPDILLARGAENFLEEYGGASIVAVNDKSIARISLKTREVKFEDA